MSRWLFFDFDGTLININKLHKQAWKEVLNEVGLIRGLGEYLPNEPFLLERFDSPSRIKENFLSHHLDQITLEYFFESRDVGNIVNSLLELKESHMLYLMSQQSASEIAQLFAPNLFQALDALLGGKNKLAILSSTNESIILSALKPFKLEDCFEMIIGSESLVNGTEWVHKYDPRIKNKFPLIRIPLENKPYYIGDDVRIDSRVARNFNFNYIQTPWPTNLMILQELVL